MTTECPGAIQCLHQRFNGRIPVSFIENDDLVSARWQGDLLLSKHLDLVPNNIYTPET